MAYRVRFTPTPGPGPPFTFSLGRADVLEDGGRLVGYRIYLEKSTMNKQQKCNGPLFSTRFWKFTLRSIDLDGCFVEVVLAIRAWDSCTCRILEEGACGKLFFPDLIHRYQKHGFFKARIHVVCRCSR
ncbi:hypothetical protein TcCL_ESM08914 [Trypanosoma cruzi]|nr:hypothetical protein TcCL_ESM08914 [Trypanosoma cruzi]